MPDAQVVTRHSRVAKASPDALWAAAQAMRLDDTRTLGRLVRWRIPGVPAEETFAGLLIRDPFTRLAEGEHLSVSGLCGRIWTLRRDYAKLGGADDFRAWREPRTVRVLFAHWVTDAGRGRATIVSEARVAPTDRVAGLRLRSVWLLVSPFERLIGAEALDLAVRRAESAR